jgi:hypothetical protein
VLVLLFIPLLLPGWTNYNSLKTASFEVFYRQGWEEEAYNLLQSMEYCRPYVEKLTGNQLGRIPFVIEDMGAMANGYTNPVGTKISVFAYPPTNNELSLAQDWWQMVGMHEYIHMSQMTRVSGGPAVLRALFGNILYPNLYQPMWMTEAITVYGESNLFPYSGRMNSGTYNAIMNALAREGKLPSTTKAGYYSYSTPLANYYVFGGSFYQYLSDTYGQDKFAQFYEVTSSSLETYLNMLAAGLTLDRYYEEVFGKPLQSLWTDWQYHLMQNSDPLPVDKVAAPGWETTNLRQYNGELYYVSFRVDKTGPASGFSGYRLMRIKDPDDPHPQELLQQSSEFGAGYKVTDQAIYYSRSELKPGFDNNEYDGYGVVTEIWRMDLDGGGRHRLAKGNIRSFCVLDCGDIVLSEDDATHQRSILYRLDPRSGEKRELGRLDHLLAELDSSDGRVFASARSFWNNASIFELQLSPLKLIPLVDTPNMENLVSAREGKLVFDAVYGGRNGSYLYELKSGSMYQFSGFSELKNAVQTPDGKTYFLALDSKGSNVYADQLKLKPFSPPVVKDVPPPYQRIDEAPGGFILDRYPVQKGSYLANIAHLLWPRMYRVPIVESTEDSLWVGASMGGNDILGDFPAWDATILYDTKSGKWQYSLGLENYFFRPVRHSLAFSAWDTRTFTSSQYVTLSRSLNYGLSEAWTGFGFTTADDLARKLWYPFLGMNFSFPGLKVQTNNALMYETQEFLASDRERLGWQGRLNLRLQAPLSSELRLNGLAAYDPDAPKDEVFPTLPGYKADWLQNRGATVVGTLYKPVIKVREGIWNPNLYLEDINLGLFAGAAVPWDRDDADTRYAYGAELVAELSAAFMLSLNLGVRFSINRDGDRLWTLIVVM